MSDRFQYLSIKYIDGNLSSVESDELVALVKGSKAYQKELAEMLVQDAAIQNVLGAQSQMENEVKTSGALKPNNSIPKHNSRRFQATKKQSPWPMVAMAAIMFIGLAIPMYLYKKGVVDQQNTKPNEIAHVGNIQSEVIDIVGTVYRAQNGNKEKLTMGAKIKTGDIIESGISSFVKLQTSAKSLIVLNQNSTFIWNEKSLDLKLGDLYAEINKKDVPAVYHLMAPDNSSITIKGTVFEWSYYDRYNSSVLKVKEGTVAFSNSKEIKLIGQNQMVSTMDFARGVQPINTELIAPWLKAIDLFRNGDLLFFDSFRGEKFSSLWTVKTTQETNHQSSPKNGLICAGKDQKIELISQEILLDGVKPLAVYFKSNSIKAANSFEYGYEIWSEEKMVFRQGYAVTQIDLIKFHVKEIRNFGDPKNLLDEIRSQKGDPKNGDLTQVDALPDIAFSLNLNTIDKKIEEKVEYKKDTLLSDISIETKFKKFKIIFYLKTINEPSKAQWSFRAFSIGYNSDATNKAYNEINNK